MTASEVKTIARECGFELAGIAQAGAAPDYERYRRWVERGLAGEMGYLSDHRANLRGDVRNLLPSARSVISVGKLYNTPKPYSTECRDSDRAWLSRYAWGDDYHTVLRRGLEELARRLGDHEFRISVDTAPLLERSWAQAAGLGWIGKNTCLINQEHGSWFFLGELLTSLELEPDAPPPDRCGTCTRCIDACPTEAIVAGPNGWELDSRRCISYFTIELRGDIPEPARAGVGRHVFGCDICQDVCPWNRDAPVIPHHELQARQFQPPLEELAMLSEAEFQSRFRDSPVRRAKHRGFLRNVAVAMGNSGSERFRAPLEHLAKSDDPLISGHARWALTRIP